MHAHILISVNSEGLQAMGRSALLYGGFTYMLSGGFGAKKQPFQYEEQPIPEF
jgi:hypothetical protein